jgi:hypothetical protein
MEESCLVGQTFVHLEAEDYLRTKTFAFYATFGRKSIRNSKKRV